MKLFLRKRHQTKVKKLSKREDKKQIRIGWNSTIVFQLAILFCLGIAFVISETNFSVEKEQANRISADFTETPYVFSQFIVQKPMAIVESKSIKNKRFDPLKSLHKIEIEKNDLPIIKVIEAVSSSKSSNDTLDTSTLSIPKSTRPESPKSINAVQFVPVFPGCELLSSNQERKECMSSKLNKFVTRKFNTENFSHLESGKTHKVNIQFTVSKNGLIKDVKAKSSERSLEKEAKRVIQKIPKMTPGKQAEKNVDVVFMIPIKFRTTQ